MNRSDAFWIVTCFFNPSGYRTPLRNFRDALCGYRATGVPVMAVEAAFGDAPFELSSSEAALQVRAPDVLWLKENLLNIAFSRLPPACRFIAWLDGNLVFERARWWEDAEELLRENDIVQLFETLTSGELVNGQWITRSDIRTEPSLFSVAREGTGKPPEPFAPGGGFAARRNVLAAGLYDRLINGGNDSIFAYAALDLLGELEIPIPELRADAEAWAHRFRSHRETGRVAVLPGRVIHMPHGHLNDRRYVTRNDIVISERLDPQRDLALTSDGCLRWASDKPRLHESMRSYFAGRNEDAPFDGAHG